MPDYKYIAVESLDEGRVTRIMLNRLRTRNAQNRGLLVELNDAFLAAEADDQVRVVILGGVGPLFSSGHDMGSKEAIAERTDVTLDAAYYAYDQAHPDQVMAAAKVRDLLAQATGCEVEARPHRLGYQVILDQGAVDRLHELLQPSVG